MLSDKGASGQLPQAPPVVPHPPVELTLFEDVGGDQVVEYVLFYRPPAVVEGQIANDGRRTGVPDRPAHSSLAQGIEDSPAIKADKEKGRYAAVHLVGMTKRPVEKLAVLARSWNRPSELTVNSGGFKSQGYNVYQRAYELASTNKGKPSSLQFTLAANEGTPVVNPAFVIKNWGDSDVELKINGKPVKRGKRFRFGHNHDMQGSDLIVWLKKKSTKPLTVSISPKG